jgi:hypothetical protein
MFQADGLRQALTTLGTLLQDRKLTFEIVAIGGGGLLLLGLIDRPTKDLDALALIEHGEYQLAKPMPPAFVEAIEDVARVLGLADDWLNPGPTDQLKHGLPVGFRERTTRHEYGALVVHLAARYDQICLKLYAAVDSGRQSTHVQDLIALNPTDDELRDAAVWVKEQDAGVDHPRFVDSVVAHIKAARGDE